MVFIYKEIGCKVVFPLLGTTVSVMIARGSGSIRLSDDSEQASSASRSWIRYSLPSI